MEMKHTLLSFVALLGAVSLFADEKTVPAENETSAPVAAEVAQDSESKAFDWIERDGQKYLLVSKLDSVKANEEFMKNVQIIGQLRQALLKLDEHRKIAFTDEEKKATDEKIKELSDKLTEGNETMAKAYGYSLTRDYVHIPVVTNVYMKLSDKEYEDMKDKLELGKDLIVKGDDKYSRVSQIPNERANEEFRRNVQYMLATQNRLRQLNEALKKMPEGEQKEKAKAQFETEEKALIEDNKKMFDAYGYSIARNYYMEIENSKLYIKVTEEEFLRAEAKSAISNDATADDVPAK